jgi:hypothetical protein
LASVERIDVSLPVACLGFLACLLPNLRFPQFSV